MLLDTSINLRFTLEKPQVLDTSGDVGLRG